MTLTESMFIEFVDNTEPGGIFSMLRAELAFKTIWINWEIIWNNWMKTTRPVLEETSVKHVPQAQCYRSSSVNYSHLLADHLGISASSSGG